VRIVLVLQLGQSPKVVTLQREIEGVWTTNEMSGYGLNNGFWHSGLCESTITK